MKGNNSMENSHAVMGWISIIRESSRLSYLLMKNSFDYVINDKNMESNHRKTKYISSKFEFLISVHTLVTDTFIWTNHAISRTLKTNISIEIFIRIASTLKIIQFSIERRGWSFFINLFPFNLWCCTVSFLFLTNSLLVSWKSKKTRAVTLSEYLILRAISTNTILFTLN